MENLTRRTVEVKIHSKEQGFLSLSLCSPKKRAPDKDNDPFQALSAKKKQKALYYAVELNERENETHKEYEMR